MNNTKIGVIGGTALQTIDQLCVTNRISVDTPYGKPSSDLVFGLLQNKEFVFLARHGDQHQIPPQLINYRANIWALKKAGVSEILAISTVGGITEAMSPGTLVVPDQIIDYTWGRPQTFFDQDFSLTKHTEFTHPYTEQCRQALISSASNCGQEIITAGTIGVTQGPRLETAAEIQRMLRDGCDMVGMTSMPEAVLAKELGIPYASLAVVVNWAAGISREDITIDDIEKVLADTANSINAMLVAY